MRWIEGELSLLEPQDRPVLGPEERILWEGFPKPGVWFEATDVFAIPFSLFWLGMVTLISIVAFTDDSGQTEPIAFVILPLFVLVGLYFVIGRFLVARSARVRTRYYLTNRRAIIREGIFRRSERSVNLAGTGEIRMGPVKDGYATIEFGASNPFYRMMPRSWALGQSGLLAPAFEKIENAEQVYRRVLEVQHPSSSGVN